MSNSGPLVDLWTSEATSLATPGKYAKSALAPSPLEVVGTAIQWPAVEVVVAGTAVVTTALPGGEWILQVRYPLRIQYDQIR